MLFNHHEEMVMFPWTQIFWKKRRGRYEENQPGIRRDMLFALPPMSSRPPCPFYGFVGMAGMLIDNKGNACGIAGGHRPCKMETGGNAPNWKRCVYYNHGDSPNDLIEKLEHVRVFPEELVPRGTRGWSGIPFSEWYGRIVR